MGSEVPNPMHYPSRRQRRELQGTKPDGRMAPARQLEPGEATQVPHSSPAGQTPSGPQTPLTPKTPSAPQTPLTPQVPLTPQARRPGPPPQMRRAQTPPTPSRAKVTAPVVPVNPPVNAPENAAVNPPEAPAPTETEASEELPQDSIMDNPKKKKHKTKMSVLVMSGMGQTMLTIGVVLGLFVVWQLYVTTWQVQGATAAAVQSFQNSTANNATATTEVQRTDPPPGVTIPAVGQTFATLHVPRWDSMVIPIMQGTNEAVLDTGYAGHYTDTQGPGELGNFALAAHRRSYGNSFRRVEELVKGDPLIVETPQAWLVYQVSSTEVVLPSQGDVIYPVPHKPKETVPTERLMTLTTCHPEYGNTERFIVYSKLSYWVPRTAGRPLALQGLEAMKKAPAPKASTEAPPAAESTSTPAPTGEALAG